MKKTKVASPHPSSPIQIRKPKSEANPFPKSPFFLLLFSFSTKPFSSTTRVKGRILIHVEISSPMASPSPSSSSSGFFAICILHSLIATCSGALMMFYLNETYVFSHGVETAKKLQGSTPHDQLLLQISDSFSGLLLFAIGFLLFMVSLVKDRDFQSFFAKGCVVLHALMALWRVWFERRVEDLAGDCPRQVVGDVMLGVSWVLFLVYSWREKYD